MHDTAVSAPEIFPLCLAQLPGLMVLITLNIFILCLKLVLHIRRNGVGFSLPNAVPLSHELWLLVCPVPCQDDALFSALSIVLRAQGGSRIDFTLLFPHLTLLLLITMNDTLSPSWIKKVLIHVKNFTLCHLSYMPRLHSVLNESKKSQLLLTHKYTQAYKVVTIIIYIFKWSVHTQVSKKPRSRAYN